MLMMSRTAHASLDGISLTVDKGELVAVLGHNGCGKTTLARHLNALLPVQEGGSLPSPAATRAMKTASGR